MKKILMGLAMALIVATSHANDVVVPTPAPPIKTDLWNGSDKKVHFGISFIAGFAISQVEPNKPKAVAYAMIPGVAKELLDDRFSGKDLVWDLAGAIAGVYSGHWMLSRQNNTTTVSYRTEF